MTGTPDSTPFSPAPLWWSLEGLPHLAVLTLLPARVGRQGWRGPWEALSEELLGAQVPVSPGVWGRTHFRF